MGLTDEEIGAAIESCWGGVVPRGASVRTEDGMIWVTSGSFIRGEAFLAA